MKITAQTPDVKSTTGRLGAFSLLEVMFAVVIFSMAMFAIFGVVSQSLGAARSLQININEPGVADVVWDLMLTNRIEEGYEEGDFGDLYPDYAWARLKERDPMDTNGLFRVEVSIINQRLGRETTTRIYRWNPASMGKTVP